MQRVTTIILLLLSQGLLLSAFPFLPPLPREDSAYNATEEGSGASGEEEEEERETPIVTAINDYVLRFFLSQGNLKEMNCSTEFLGQDVSRHLCNSNRVTFISPQGIELNGTQETDNHYELCVDDDGLEAGHILGYDLALYRRPTAQNTSSPLPDYIALVTETVWNEHGGWQQVLSDKNIDGNATGWQVFHLAGRHNPNTSFCVKINMLGSRGFLNRSSIQEVFVTNKNKAHESTKQPVIAKYIDKHMQPPGVSPFVPSTDPFPFFNDSFSAPRETTAKTTTGTTSDLPTELPTEQRDKRSDECTVEENPVNLSGYFDHDVVAPRRVNLGKCSGQAARKYDAGAYKVPTPEEEDVQQSFDSICHPMEFEDLTVLIYSQLHDNLFFETIPNTVIKKCGHLSLGKL